MKQKYNVYSKYYFDSEEAEDCFEGKWKHEGETYAVSEEKAINNVRFRKYGNVSQHKPIATSGHWENGRKWKAVPAGV